MTARDKILAALKTENQVIQPDPFRKALLEGWLGMEAALGLYTRLPGLSDWADAALKEAHSKFDAKEGGKCTCTEHLVCAHCMEFER